MRSIVASTEGPVAWEFAHALVLARVKNNNVGNYAPCNGSEREGWVRQEYSGHEYRGALCTRGARGLHCGLRSAALQPGLAGAAAGGFAGHQRGSGIRAGLAQRGAHHRNPGHRRACARARHRAQRTGAAGGDHHRPGAAVHHRYEGLRPFHGGIAGNRQGVAQAGAAGRRRQPGARIHADLRGARPVSLQAQDSLPRASARSAELRARLRARHGGVGAARISRVARLEAVGTDRRASAVSRRTPSRRFRVA